MPRNTFYVLKVKGKAKIPDYIQVRDASFTLIGYFRPGRSTRHSQAQDGDAQFARLEEAAQNLPYGVITKLELDEDLLVDPVLPGAASPAPNPSTEPGTPSHGS